MDAVRSMLQSMRYRGPDHLGVFADGPLVMGNVRLAIQGLDATGNQPLFNEDRSVVTVYNGEIYNHPEIRRELIRKGHVFSSTTDTELLVHLYEEHGPHFSGMLNGMFAFAVYDIGAGVLVLGRDRSGQKPLFVAETPQRLIFASELRAMLPQLETARLDPDSVGEFLSLGYVLEPNSIIEGVRTVEPGTVEVIETTGSRRSYFWTPGQETAAIQSAEEWMEEAEPIFRAAMKRHVLSDVPVTLFLSGGVDSSLLAALLAGNSSVTEVYSGSFADAPDHDEYIYASSMADTLGLVCNRVDLRADVLLKNLPGYLASLSQPSGDTSGVATYTLAKETSKEYRVVLGGDAGDELFGGYPTYYMPAIKRFLGWIPSWSIRAGWKVSARCFDTERYMSLPFRLQQLNQAWGHDHAESHYLLKCFLPRESMGLLKPEFQHSSARGMKTFRNMFDGFATRDVPLALGTLDFMTFLRSGTIPKVERNNMHFSLEARLPLLDNEILDLSARTPSAIRFKDRRLKSPLRMLLKRVQGEISASSAAAPNPRKQGFSPPLRRLLDAELQEWRRELLSRRSVLFAADTYERIDAMRDHGWDTHRLEWNICILKHWIEDNGVSI